MPPKAKRAKGVKRKPGSTENEPQPTMTEPLAAVNDAAARKSRNASGQRLPGGIRPGLAILTHGAAPAGMVQEPVLLGYTSGHFIQGVDRVVDRGGVMKRIPG